MRKEQREFSYGKPTEVKLTEKKQNNSFFLLLEKSRVMHFSQ